MFPGRHPGFRTVQGLTIKSQFEKLWVAAEQERDRFIQTSRQNWRIKTVQNLVSAILSTIAATVVLSLAGAGTGWAIRVPVVVLAITALICNAVLVVRRHAEKAVVHLQIAERYGALAASCRASVTKYEERLIEDVGLQSLLEQHTSDLDLLRKNTAAA